MNKLLVLGIDGLEATLIEEWNLTNLQQDTYGTYPIGKEYYHPIHRVPYTPTIWASIITGLKPSKHNVRSFYTWGNILDKIRMLPPISRVKGKRKILCRFRIYPKPIKVRCKTLFDIIHPSKSLWVPGLDPTPYCWLFNDVSLYELEQKALNFFAMQYKVLLRELSNNWKLLFIWLNIADVIGHLHFVKRKHKLLKTYNMLDRTVKEIREKCEMNILILSDHGMKISGDGITGTHSDYGFWSFNNKINWWPKGPTDFFYKILELCGHDF